MTKLIDAQEWLDYNYPKYSECRNKKDHNNRGKKRHEIKKLNCNSYNIFYSYYSDNKLMGLLDLSGFTNLEELNCSNNHLASLNLTDCVQLKTIKAEENNLVGLDLSRNVNLKELDCKNNRLTSLDLRVNTKLTSLNCCHNQLTCLNFQNNLQLEKINISYNQIRANLDIFSHLKKLINLTLDKSYRESAGNNFFGSLASLRECESLIHLSLDYQKNITGELKDLPVDSLRLLSCSETDFHEEFKDYNLDFRKWWVDKQLAEKDEELEIEREANIESAQAMDRFYRGQFIENKDPDNVIKNNFANDYLSLNQENQHLKKQNSELKSSSELVVKLFETNILVSELEEKTDRITVLENELQIAQEKITNYEKKLKKVLGESDLANWKNKVVKKSELDKVNAKLTSLQRQLEVLNTQKLELVTFTNNLEKEIDNLRQKETNLMIVNRNLQETEKSLKKCNNYHKAAEVGLAIIAGIALAGIICFNTKKKKKKQ